MFGQKFKYLQINPIKSGVNLTTIIPKYYNDYISKTEKYEKLFEEGSPLQDRYLIDLEDFCRKKNLNNVNINLNYFKLITLKIADLVCSYTPSVKSKEHQEKVDEILKRIDFKNYIYNTVVDTLKLGGSTRLLYKDNNMATHTVINQDMFFPILKNDMSYKIDSYLILNLITINQNTQEQQLIEQHHFKGYYILKKWNVSAMNVGTLISEERINTGLDDFAIIYYSNIKNSMTDIFGESDLRIIESIISEIKVRLMQISINNNKFSNPTVIVEPDALTENEDGSYSFKTGEAYTESQESKGTTRYLESNATYDSCFKELEFLIKQLAVLSELGMSVMGLDESGLATSGIAMQYKLMSPLSKAKRVTRLINDTVKQEITYLCKLDGVVVDDIEIEWYDALPDDPKSDVDYVTSRINNKTMTIVDAIKYLNENISDEDAEAKAEEIKAEQANEINFASLLSQ